MPSPKGGRIVNKCILCGRLTRDPDMKDTQSGTPMARFTMAVDRRKKKDGTQEADFPSIVAFGKTAEFCQNYLCKGQRVLVEGRIQTGKYDKDGTTVYTTDVIAENIEFADSKKKEDAGTFAAGEDIPY